jgi:hypothetical protein
MPALTLSNATVGATSPARATRARNQPENFRIFAGEKFRIVRRASPTRRSAALES